MEGEYRFRGGGQLELGPSAQYVVLLDEEYLQLPSEQGYTKFEHVRSRGAAGGRQDLERDPGAGPMRGHH